MILPERVFGRSGVNMICFGSGERADHLGDVLAHLGRELSVGFVAVRAG